MDMLLDEIRAALRRQKAQFEQVLAQVPAERWGERLDAHDGNSLSILLRHLAGNLRSRWTNPFTTDGEKPDRNRDAEFEDAVASREALQETWEGAWAVALATIDALTPGDLARTLTIRGQATPVAAALVRTLDHTGHHVGQAVLIAKHLLGPDWRTLSMPRRRV